MRLDVTDSPTALNTDDTGGIAGSGVAVKNLGSDSIVVGGADVTFADGYPVVPGGELALDFESGAEVVYGVADTGVVVPVAVIRTGV